jgi:hypothetical protein
MIKKYIVICFYVIFLIPVFGNGDINFLFQRGRIMPVAYLRVLAKNDRNEILNFNKNISNNTSYDFANERNTHWFERGTYELMELSKYENELRFGNGYEMDILKIEKNNKGYDLLVIQSDYSIQVFRNDYTSIIDLSSLMNMKNAGHILMTVDGDFVELYTENKKFVQKYFIADKNTYDQIVSLVFDDKMENSLITWPRHADGTCDFDGSIKPEGVKKTSPAISVSGATKFVTTNLRLRSTENTSSTVITTMRKGTAVKIIKTGGQDTIDGITSNWVQVEVQAGAKDRDGKTINAGTTGWCFGGYLE